jgi:hypothetical protein
MAARAGVRVVRVEGVWREVGKWREKGRKWTGRGRVEVQNETREGGRKEGRKGGTRDAV